MTKKQFEDMFVNLTIFNRDVFDEETNLLIASTGLGIHEAYFGSIQSKYLNQRIFKIIDKNSKDKQKQEVLLN